MLEGIFSHVAVHFIRGPHNYKEMRDKKKASHESVSGELHLMVHAAFTRSSQLIARVNTGRHTTLQFRYDIVAMS